MRPSAIIGLLLPLNSWGAPWRPVDGDRAKARGVDKAKPHWVACTYGSRSGGRVRPSRAFHFTGDASPMAVLLLSLLGDVAEFERALILERPREGVA